MIKLISKIVILVGCAFLVIWDFIALFTGGIGDTISGVIWEWTSDWPVIAFVAGFVCGHLFFRGRGGHNGKSKNSI